MNNTIRKIKENLYKKMSYTNQDFESIMNQFIDIVQSDVLPVQWNNLTETDPIMMLFSLVAAHIDMLNYMVDYRLLESYMSTARQRVSMKRIADSFGYKIPGPSAARIQYKIKKENILPGSKIKPFSLIYDDNEVPWTYAESSIDLIEIENNNEDLILEYFQGIPQEFSFKGRHVDHESNTIVFGGSKVAFENSFNNRPVASLVFNNNILFKYEDLRYLNDANNNYFTLDKDTSGLNYIKFIYGLDIENEYNGDFVLNYIDTYGEENISLADATITLIDSEGNPYEVLAEYVDSSYYRGKDEAEADEIKEGFKRFYTGTRTLITPTNYRNYITDIQKIIPNISKCFVLDTQIDSSGGPGNENIDELTVAIYITKEKGGVHSIVDNVDLINELLDELNKHKVTGINLLINKGSTTESDYDLSGEKLEIPITFEGATNKTKESIKKAIEEYILNQKNIGDIITHQEINNMLAENNLLNEIDYLEYTFKKIGNSNTVNTIELEFYQFIDEVEFIE